MIAFWLGYLTDPATVKSLHVYDFDRTCKCLETIARNSTDMSQYSRILSQIPGYGTARLFNFFKTRAWPTEDGGKTPIFSFSASASGRPDSYLWAGRRNSHLWKSCEAVSFLHCIEWRSFNPSIAERFREWLENLNRKLPAKSTKERRFLKHKVIQEAECCTYLSPVLEAAEVLRMVKSHNDIISRQNLNLTKSRFGRLHIIRTISYTGYMVSKANSNQLINQLLLPTLPPGLADSGDIKYMAESILITPHSADRSIHGPSRRDWQKG